MVWGIGCYQDDIPTGFSMEIKKVNANSAQPDAFSKIILEKSLPFIILEELKQRTFILLRMDNYFESCYNNYLNFDLKRLHIRESINSEYHTIDGRPLTIEDLESNEVNFSDGLSSSFKLVNINGLNFLKGENSIYPCSIVFMNNQGYKWVNLLIIPNGNQILFNQKNSIIRFNSNNIYEVYSKIANPELLEFFLNKYVSSFEKNEWFSKVEIIQIIKKSSLPISQRFKFLFKKGLLNPFQLSLSSVFYDFRISNQDLYNSLLVNNDIPLGIDYLSLPSFKIRFSKSSNLLISLESFKHYIFSLDQDEVDSFFELEYIRDFLLNKYVYDDLIFDVLSIDDLNRNDANNVGLPGWRFKILRMNEIGLNIDFIKSYYSRLISNLRSLENTIRSKKGFNLVGSLYNESLLFKLISEAFPNLTIISQYSPVWLGKQRFDIYIKELNLAIEYNGKQHYEPIGFYGGLEGYQNTLKRDEEKRRKCIQNNCRLIEIKYDENFEDSLKRIRNFF